MEDMGGGYGDRDIGANNLHPWWDQVLGLIIKELPADFAAEAFFSDSFALRKLPQADEKKLATPLPAKVFTLSP